MTFRVCAVLAAVLAVSVSVAAAQGSAGKASAKTRSTTGVVSSVSAASLVLEGSSKKPMTFTVDRATKILKQGATAKTKERQAAGAPGLVITDVGHSRDTLT